MSYVVGRCKVLTTDERKSPKVKYIQYCICAAALASFSQDLAMCAFINTVIFMGTSGSSHLWCKTKFCVVEIKRII